MESRVGDRIILTCVLHKVHHEVDFNNFHVQWMVMNHSASISTKKKRGDLEAKTGTRIIFKRIPSLGAHILDYLGTIHE